MKDSSDTFTVDFCPAPVHSRKGRKRKYANNAERVAAFRARKNKRSLTADVSPEVHQLLAEFMRRRVDSDNPSETKSEVIERALKAFLRKR